MEERGRGDVAGEKILGMKNIQKDK
jgi:hypothetical protein